MSCQTNADFSALQNEKYSKLLDAGVTKGRVFVDSCGEVREHEVAQLRQLYLELSKSINEISTMMGIAREHIATLQSEVQNLKELVMAKKSAPK